MIQLIAPEFHETFSDEIETMQRLRRRVFMERLGWDVSIEKGMEADNFDALRPHYLLLRGEHDSVEGCVRLLPTTGPTMLRDVFPTLLKGHEMPCGADIWESSRFALDPDAASDAVDGLAEGTYELLAGVIEFGLASGITRIVTVTDVRMERILRRAGWPLERFGEPQEIGSTRAVAGNLEVSGQILNSVRDKGGLEGPVLWAPVMASVA